MSERWTGGCQCGAVRFAVEGPLGRASICHCRMCQKATGSPFAALVSVEIKDVVWTKGERGRFQSSNKVARGFCAACGTPLTFEWGEKFFDLAIATFDRAAEITPVIQMDRETRLPWVDHLADLPVRTPQEAEAAQGWLSTIVSYQHPDHD
jgi:hypothetical protein